MRACIPIDYDALASFCQRWSITELALFGSVLRDDFGPDSDIDVLVTFAPDATWSVERHLTMHAELQCLFGRAVDLVERKAVEQSANYIRRNHILHSAVPVVSPSVPDVPVQSQLMDEHSHKEQTMPGDNAYLVDMLASAYKIQRITANIPWSEFEQDSGETLQDAVIRRLEVIGEAASKLSPAFRAAHPALPWSSIIGLRNILIHEYARVDLAKVWSIVQQDIPVLVTQLEPLVPPEEEG